MARSCSLGNLEVTEGLGDNGSYKRRNEANEGNETGRSPSRATRGGGCANPQTRATLPQLMACVCGFAHPPIAGRRPALGDRSFVFSLFTLVVWMDYSLHSIGQPHHVEIHQKTHR